MYRWAAYSSAVAHRYHAEAHEDQQEEPHRDQRVGEVDEQRRGQHHVVAERIEVATYARDLVEPACQAGRRRSQSGRPARGTGG